MVYMVLGGGWFLQDRLVPAGTVYNGSRPADIAWTNWITSTGQGGVPPVTVQSWDQESYNAQRARFPDGQIPATPAGIIRAP
jgi:hypothetical protein